MYRVETITTGLGGSPYYTRVHFGEQADVDEAGAQLAVDLMTLFWAALGEGASPILTDIDVAVQPEVTVIDVPTGQPTNVWVTDPDAVVIGDSGSPGPLAAQGLVQLLTSTYRNGRRVRGKIFVPGIERSNTGPGGAMGSSAVTALGAAGSILVLPSDPAPPLVIYSRPVEGGAPGATSLVTSAVGWNQWATLRSRRD